MNLSYLVLALGVAIGAMSLRSPHSAPGVPVHANIEWPAEIGGVPLEPLPLSAMESGFATAFPGAIARFRCGNDEVILRHVNRATRKLHDSATCLKAAGFQIEATPGHRPDDGWSRFRACRTGQTLHVREQIKSASNPGVSWTDVSRWFWHATFHPNDGPWMAVTVLEPSASR